MIPFSGHKHQEGGFDMRILLLNDNPVARKLVALSAQYTKNDLTVIGSIAEIEQSIYDVVIVDDAYYSDEMMSVLSQKVTYSVSILMAARANTVSEGFDKVLSKPFLPADLIEFLIEIQETLPAPSAPVVEDIPLSVEPLPPLKEVSSFSEPEPVASFDDLLPPLKEEPSFFSEPENVTTFNDPLPPLKEESSTSFGFAPLQEELEEEPLISFEEFAAPQESEARPSVFHHEAVQDLQDLLKTTDAEESDFSMGSFDLPEVETQEVEVAPFVSEPSQEENFFDAPLLSDTETSFGILSDDYLPLLEEKRDIIETSADEELYDEFIPAEPFAMNTKESIHPHAEEMKTAFYSDETSGDFFTGIPEREMKLAMGEPVEEITYDIPVVMSQTAQGGVSSEGMEALQVLLKALSNEETANSLKGLNISININLNLGQSK
jgi:hypothetical protein